MRRPFAIPAVLAGLLLALIGAAAPSAAAGTDEKLPVPYTFFPDALVGAVPPGGSAPGSNDWSCTPSRKHPRPVVLVHGTFGSRATNWQTYAPLLHNKGYCVFALTYGQLPTPDPATQELGGMARMEDSARELKRFVRKVLRRTGAQKVYIVGHSQGTLMPNWYVKFLGGARHVRNYVSLAPLWHGTAVTRPAEVASVLLGEDAATPVCEACGQFAPGSAFMRKMRAGGVAVSGIRYTNIVTRYDQLVVPYSSGIEEGMTNHVVQDHCATDFSEHFEIAADPVAAALVLNALDRRNARPVPCELVLPLTGTPAPPAG